MSLFPNSARGRASDHNFTTPPLVVGDAGEIVSGTVFSDNGRACFKCGGHVKAYTLHADITLIDTFCFGCHRREPIHRESTRAEYHHAREVSEWDRRRVA